MYTSNTRQFMHKSDIYIFSETLIFTVFLRKLMNSNKIRLNLLFDFNKFSHLLLKND